MSAPPRKPTIAIAGLAIETSTFSPAVTHAPAFHPRTGTAAITAYHAAVLGPGTPLASAARWRGALIGHALPGGEVTRDAFEALSADLVARLAAIANAADTTAEDAESGSSSSSSLDGLWFDIHGAMCVRGLDDPEAELLRRCRAAVGPRCAVAASMDLHGNVSRALAHGCDLLTCYRTAPHVDVVETRARALRGLLEVLRRRDEYERDEESGGGGKGASVRPPWRPLKAWIPVPILLPGEQTSTRDEPAREIYAAVPRVVAESAGEVLDAAVWVGYAWADAPRNRAAVVATGWDRAAVAAAAEELARLFWARRAGFRFVAPTGTLDECLDAALAGTRRDDGADGDGGAERRSRSRPFFISDSGDNPTAGGSGDVTWGLTRLLARDEFKSPDGPTVIYASVPGPAAVEAAARAGVGATVTVTAGAEVDDVHAGPLTMTGRVHAIKQGDKDAEVEVVLQVGSVLAILTRLRKPYHRERDFTDLALRPRDGADVVVVKIGYLEPELYDMAAAGRGWMLALTPGGVDQDLERLGHRRIRRPMWPFDKEWETEPDLRARMIPASNEELEGPDE